MLALAISKLWNFLLERILVYSVCFHWPHINVIICIDVIGYVSGERVGWGNYDSGAKRSWVECLGIGTHFLNA